MAGLRKLGGRYYSIYPTRALCYAIETDKIEPPQILFFYFIYMWSKDTKSGEFLVLGRCYLGPRETFASPPPPTPQ